MAKAAIKTIAETEEVEAPSQVITEEPKKLGAGLFPVRILKGYRPLGEFVMRPRANPEDEFSPRIVREPTAEERMKVVVGRHISLPLDEAKELIRRGAAERDDEMKVD